MPDAAFLVLKDDQRPELVARRCQKGALPLVNVTLAPNRNGAIMVSAAGLSVMRSGYVAVPPQGIFTFLDRNAGRILLYRVSGCGTSDKNLWIVARHGTGEKQLKPRDRDR